MSSLKFELPKRIKKDTKFSNFHASDLFSAIMNPVKPKDDIGLKENEAKTIYEWEEKLFKDKKLIPKNKTFSNLKQMSLDNCYLFVNRIFKQVFEKLTLAEGGDSLMIRQHSYFFNGDAIDSIPKIMPFGIVNKKKLITRADANFMTLTPTNNYFLHHDWPIKELIDWYYTEELNENTITVKDVQELFDEDEDREPFQVYDIYYRTKKISLNKKNKSVRLSYRPQWCGMHLPFWARNKFIMLHEVAHLLARDNNGHGNDFMAVLIYLYYKYLKLSLHSMVNSLEENKINIDTKHSLLYKYFHTPMNEEDSVFKRYEFDKI